MRNVRPVLRPSNIYYTALAPAGARHVPALLFTGETDLEFRTNTIVGLFAVNRRAGALWALTQEPGIGHEVGRSRDMAAIFFEDMLGRRLPATNEGGAIPAATSGRHGWIPG